MQAMHVTTLKLEERMQASGPNVITQAQPSMYGPQGTSHKPVHESKEDVGLFHSGASFNLGLASSKQQTAQGVRKIRVGIQKKNKENRGVPGKENKSGNEETQFQGDKTKEATTMEFQKVDMGIKRRARVPLTKLEDKEDNGKRIKREGG